MTISTRVTILKAVIVAVFATTAFFLATLLGVVRAPVDLFFRLALWPANDYLGLASVEARLLLGVCAGLLAGWGLSLWYAVTGVYAKDPEMGRPIVLYPLIVWFVIDGVGSVLSGAWFNAVLNLAFFLPALVALSGKAEADQTLLSTS